MAIVHCESRTYGQAERWIAHATTLKAYFATADVVVAD